MSYSVISMMPLFFDRNEAGNILSTFLTEYQNQQPIILAIPRGGVPVGYEIAKKLNVSLTVIVARKIGVPQQPELGIGAISELNAFFFDEQRIESLDISPEEIASIVKTEKQELERRVNLYRQGKSLPMLYDHTAIITDDGLATGVTAQAVIMAVRQLQPKYIVFAAPVCDSETKEKLSVQVNNIVCSHTANEFAAVGSWYQHFNQVSDEEVIQLLDQAKQ